MAYEQADLDAIDGAIASGALTVRYNDRSVTYRSLDELHRIRETISQSLTSKPQPMQQRIKFRRPGGRGAC